ncbi:MAG: SLBB domain-containing protein [Acidobacteriota bacterium]
MPSRSITSHGITTGRRAPLPGWKRLLAVLLMAPLASSGCVGGGSKPPRDQQDIEALLGEYEDQLVEQGLTVEEVAAQRSGDADDFGVAASDSADTDDSARPAAPSTLLGEAKENSTFKLVNGVPEYRIGRGDLLRVTSYLGPEQREARLRVQPDGTVYVPRFQIGPVIAAGLAPTELADFLIERYREFAPTAYIQVEVEEHRAWIATLLGEIRINVGVATGSGDYSLTGKTTVAEFVYDHGGPTPDADLSDVRLIRGDTEVRLDLAAAVIRARADQNPVLETGDVVMVPSREIGSGRYYVLGEVTRPGVFSFAEGMSVMDALAQAGAFSPAADPKNTSIARRQAGGTIVVPVNVEAIAKRANFSENVPLQRGDVVFVPKRPERFSTIFARLITVASLVATVVIIIVR